MFLEFPLTEGTQERLQNQILRERSMGALRLECAISERVQELAVNEPWSSVIFQG